MPFCILDYEEGGLIGLSLQIGWVKDEKIFYIAIQSSQWTQFVI